MNRFLIIFIIGVVFFLSGIYFITGWEELKAWIGLMLVASGALMAGLGLVGFLMGEK